MDRRRFILLLLTTLAITCCLVFVLVSRHGKTAVTFLTSPDLTEITFNDQKLTGSQTIYLPPGDYTFTGRRTGFEDRVIKTTISTKPTKVLFSLTPITDEAKKESNNSSQLAAIDQAETENLNREQETLEADNPVIKNLPIKNLIYSIGYRRDPANEKKVIVEIDTSRGYRNSALQVIQQNSFDPTKLNINFKNYSNPFAR